ncbi:MAG: hypothetical protein K2X86_09255 [Cytophagaceae bacterium]|nr:hypothetical protein [Cytophagaceae bacterium]
MTKKSFANMITVIRLHLMSYVALVEFIIDAYKTWKNITRRLFMTKRCANYPLLNTYKLPVFS